MLGAIGACVSTTGHWQAGQNIVPGVTRGARATLDYESPALCNENGNNYQSFSSAWVALETVSGTADDIHQVGFLKCQACSPFTSNTVYWIYAYGHEATATCGLVAHPTAKPVGVASVSAATFKVRRATDIDNDPIYAAYVGSVKVDDVTAASLDSCWPNGPRKAIFHEEVAQKNGQAGGTTANKRDWISVKYEDSSLVWHPMNATLGITCTQRDLTSMGCSVSATSHDAFRSWDTRT